MPHIKTEYGDIHTLKGNPRTITDDALAKLAESIRRDPEFMRLRPIVIDGDGTVIGGNQRLRACTEILGMSELPPGWVIRADNLTPEQRKRFVIVDNSPEGMAGAWDFEALRDWSADIDLGGLGINLPFCFDPIPTGNKAIDEEAMKETEHECPKCGFKW
jgi:hypothetical protein